jgi:UDP-4-amino-4,6-dideoxy-N-acetyl-beta-L-altrosamine transaminase
MRIPYCQPWIGDEEIKEVTDTLKSGWLSMGPKTIEFERLLAEYTGAEYAVAVNSCTAALHLSLLALGIKEGDEVITTPFTFTSTGNTIIHTGATPVFVDIERDTYNIDPGKVEEAITRKTRAILPVHYAGHPCEMREIKRIAREHNLYVVEDAAHALGSEYEGVKIGALSESTCFSFYPTKSITTGEGGAITTNDEIIAEKARILRLHGINKNAWMRYSSTGTWFYEVKDCGWKYNISDIHAAIGIVQLQKLDRFIRIRREYAKIYSEELGKIDSVIVPDEKPNVKHSYHIYPILLTSFNRDKFIEKMRAKGVICSVHFIPLHMHPFYRERFGFKEGAFPNAEWVYKREVSLPLYPKMTKGELQYVINCVKYVLMR